MELKELSCYILQKWIEMWDEPYMADTYVYKDGPSSEKNWGIPKKNPVQDPCSRLQDGWEWRLFLLPQHQWQGGNCMAVWGDGCARAWRFWRSNMSDGDDGWGGWNWLSTDLWRWTWGGGGRGKGWAKEGGAQRKGRFGKRQGEQRETVGQSLFKKQEHDLGQVQKLDSSAKETKIGAGGLQCW